MENSEKAILEKIKTLKLNNLFQLGDYVDIYINKKYYQGIIKEVKEKNKYDVLYDIQETHFNRKKDASLSSLSIIGEYTTSPENIMRKRCLNNDIYQSETKEVIDLLNQNIQELNIDLNKNEIIETENNENKENNKDYYKGYSMHQFLSGTFIDILAFIYNEIEPDKKNTKSLNKLILLCLDIVIFILEQIKLNLSKIKFFINNRQSLIFENIYSIFASFQIILSNIQFIFSEDFFCTEKITETKSKIINECYQLILSNSKNYYIPLPILVQLISFITLNN